MRKLFPIFCLIWGACAQQQASDLAVRAQDHLGPVSVEGAPGTGDIDVAEIRIPMRDEARLFGCLWRPASAAAGERFPVLLKFDPYAGSCRMRDPFERYAKAGYAVVYAHVRGTGSSNGVFPDREYSDQELDDAVHVIEWLSRQDWSTGEVGMFGESWSGFNAIQVGMRKPPALKAIVAAVATENIYHEDAHFADGILVLSDWTISADVGLIDSAEPTVNPFDEATIRDRFDRPPWSLLYLRHQRDGEFWRHHQRLDVNPGILNVPTMMIGGWYDGYRSAVFRAMQNMRAPFKAIVGPWDHGMSFPAPEADLTAATVRWWDYWLKGVENGVLAEPTVHVYMRRPHTPGPGTSAVPGEWRGVAAWPPEGHRERTLHFTSDGGLREVANEVDTHHLRYIPTGGVQAGIWWGDPMPDQRPADALSLIYESEPLEQEIQLLGRPRANLRASASAPLANWMVRLSDVAPDGTVTLITGAGQNGAYRRSSMQPEPLTPGETVSLDIPLHFTSWIFEPGHRIRVAVSNALWPMFWPTPYPMTTTLDIGPGRSRISLPTIPAQNREAARQAAVTVDSENLGSSEARSFPAAESVGWIGPARIERDEIAGITTVKYNFGTTSRIVVKYQAWDNDPAKARYVGTLRARWPWNSEEAELYGETEIISDATTFHYRHMRRLLSNGTIVRERIWEERVPRDHQ
jgi:uncharacterized protein